MYIGLHVKYPSCNRQLLERFWKNSKIKNLMKFRAVSGEWQVVNGEWGVGSGELCHADRQTDTHTRRS